jgi:cation diffusion facilitator CzcD-associated flavoprotein CzcO
MSSTNMHVAIAGSGFAGLGLAIRLAQAGNRDFTIFERASSLGGVWRDNTYPGVSCDVPAHLYSYSFEPNPHWSRLFAPQREILAYLEACADKYDIRRHIRFNNAVAAADFDEGTGLWRVTTSDGNSLQARFLVSASGHALTTPVLPKLPGASLFKGSVFHSARWNHGESLKGKRVAVVGTGASAIQIVPNIVDDVAQLTVFQRTAPWVLPRNERPMTEKFQAQMKRWPVVQKALRGAIYSAMESMAVGFVVDPKINKLRERGAIKHLHSVVPDAALRAKLTPQFQLGCKRILYSDTYYAALGRPHVEVVIDAISSFNSAGIVDATGRQHAFDMVVYATGFEASEAAAPFPIRGRAVDGRIVDVATAWQDGIEAYLGTTISGLPNFFMMLGPNTGLGHSSMIYMMESQMNYLLDAFSMFKREQLRWVDVKANVQRHFNDGIQGRLKSTIWQTGCQSWYLRPDGKNTTVWPGFTFEYRNRLRKFDIENYTTMKSAS